MVASGQQRHPGLQVADVADHDGPGPVGGGLAAVDGDLHLGDREHQRLQRRPDVGEPADLRLDVLVDALHDRGVEAHAGHHHEVGVLELVAGDRDHVDGAVLAGERDVDRGPHVERDVEVAGQQVAGAGGHDADGDAGAGELGADLAHRAVAAADDDQVGAVDGGLRRPGRCRSPRPSSGASSAPTSRPRRAIALTIAWNWPTSSTFTGLRITASRRSDGTACGSGSTFSAWLRGSGL